MAAGCSRELCSLLQIILLFGLLSHTTTSEDVSYSHLERDLRSSRSEFSEVLVRVRRDVADGDNSTIIPSSTSAPGTTPQQVTSMETTSTSLPATTTPSPATTAQPSTMSPDSTASPTTMSPPTPSTTMVMPSTTKNYTEKIDNHNYYNSRVYTSGSDDFWIDLEAFEKSQITTHGTLSESHRTAATQALGFRFLFYGHQVEKVTIATGGFLYMSAFLHQWLTATQYIAPLMANFDTRLGNGSQIHFAKNGKVFIVYWDQVHLQDLPSAGSFRFQVQLHRNGTIVFAYQDVPVAVDNIPSTQHPVKVGLSDAYYIDTTTTYNVKRRTIYEYHRVEIQKTRISDTAAVVITPLPTCILYKDCNSCIVAITSFDCLWCPSQKRCSNGFDRFRQDWINNNCQNTVNKQQCPPAEVGGKKSKFIVNPGIIIAVLFIVVLVAALIGWIIYAYRNPETRSGQWLIKHRPSELKGKIKFWKKGETAQSGEKYQVSIEPHMDSVA